MIRCPIVDFRNSVVVVTGAASGIGRAAALTFARAGADVVLADVNTSGMAEVRHDVEALGCRAMDVQVDVSAHEQVGELARRAIEWRGRVDLVMNNAGVPLNGPVTEHSLADWRAVMDVNLWGVIHGVHYFLPHMLERRSGYFVNVASLSGLSGIPGQAAYSTSKFGVIGLSEAVRAEVAGRGVGVTAVCPGYVDTGFCEQGALARANLPWRTPEGVMRKVMRAIDHRDALCLVSPETRVTYLAKRYAPRLLASLQQLAGPRLARLLSDKPD
jgi:NAD(P)-dependent dehydrogenase (short-subunit alcohol dehydrogenase family)